MPVPVLIQSQLDERSATAAADRIQRVFADAGKNAGKEMSQALGAGLGDSERDVQRVARTAADAYDKMRDAAGKLRAEEERLKKLQSDGASNDRIVRQAETLERARRAEARAARDAVTAYGAYEQAASQTVSRLSALANFTQGLGVGFGGFGTAMSTATTAASGLTSAIGVGNAGLVGGVGAVVVGTGLATKALYDMGKQWDDIGDSIAVRTGLIGTDLKALTDSVKDIAPNTAAPLEKIGDVAGRVSQSLHLTGGAAADMTQRIAELGELTGEGIDVRGLGQLFAVSNVGPGQMAGSLNEIITVSQATGVSINQLVGIMRNTSTVTREFGLSFQETAALVSTFSEAGVDLNRVAPGMSKALKQFAADGREPVAALQDTITEIKRLSDSGQDVDAAALAFKNFGKGAAEFLGPIKDGRLDVEAFNNALKDNGDVLKNLVKDTDDWQQSWKRLTNTFSGVFAPVAETVFGTLSDALTGIMMQGQAFSQMWDTIFTSVERVNVATGEALTLQAQVTPLELANPSRGVTTDLNSMLFPNVPPGAAAQLPYPTTRPGTQVQGLGPNFYKEWYGDGTKAKKEGLPDAPVLPLDYTQLPGGTPSSILSAQTRLDESAHTLAEKKARLTQLEQTNIATAEDIQTARNAVTEAERNQLQAQSALGDAQLRLFEQSNKQLTTQAKQLGEIGASIDQDFGISKGLAGIAENITRFIANVAAAPLLGKLGAVSAMSPSQGGYGALGVAAASGAFGPGYTGIDYTKSASPQQVSQLGPTALQATQGNPNLAAMMSLAQSSSGNVKYAGASDLIGGLADCSGSISDLVEVLQTGKSTSARLFDTTAFANDASAAKLGFQPGYQPGALNVGVTPLPGMSGHMAATLPNGVNFEGGGGTGGGAQYGGSATGALDPQFSKRYHMPVGGPPASSAPNGGYAPMTQEQLTNPALTSPTGTGTGAGFPGMGGPPQSTTRIGGVAPTGGKGQGGIGYQQGGLIDLAIQAGGMGADMFAPGAGQAAQTGAKLLNRTIQYGGQMVGIGVSGLMDTFLPTGGSELANNNWFTRILGGIAGAGAAIPNIAGGKDAQQQQGPLSPEQAAAYQQQQGGKSGDTNITVNNQRATEDGTGRDIAWHQELANSAPGM